LGPRQDTLSTNAEVASLAVDLRAFAENCDNFDERARLLRAAAALEEAIHGQTNDVGGARWEKLSSVARRVVNELKHE
jgi:hypothetical protein